MSVNYQKLYTYLVGQIDETLKQIAEELIYGHPGWTEMMEVGSKLKLALLAAEEMYLEEEKSD